MSFKFVCDRIVKGKAYPALAQWQAEPYTNEWQQFVYNYPYTVPCELIEHCAEFGFPYTISTIEDSEPGDFYVIGLGFFDFNIDYFSLIPPEVFEKKLKILFYYHEGDNPFKIKRRLDSLCSNHAISQKTYCFVSGNTNAEDIPGFFYFPDHELLYWRRNRNTPPTPLNLGPRSRDFTVLSRTHKWWRATIMADLHRNKLLDNSYWSYRTDIALNEFPENNPIRAQDLNIEYYVNQFLKGAPYSCDDLTPQEHNNHAITPVEHYTNSYCNIVLETHYDADQTHGTFLTEKTFKPIKHAQPFIVAAPAGTLQTLRNLGYRTFDHAIDNSYDLEYDNTERWRKLFRTICKVKDTDHASWFEQCRNDIEHNQQLFASSKYSRLNNLYDKLLH